jgi:8-amino-7-oxononanoate synthase
VSVEEEVSPPLNDLHSDLKRLEQTGRFRALAPQRGIDFSSNDYLGLARSQELQDAALLALADGTAVGSGGSRLLRGNCVEHEELEDFAAKFFRSESALYFATGFAANMALLSALPQKGDQIFYDELVHASAHDGIKLSRAKASSFPHNDSESLGEAIRLWRRRGGVGIPWIAVESLYSMDGDFAPLEEFSDLAERHEAILLIDEAHATGVFGERGMGRAGNLHSRANVITLHTLGKALGCEGSLVCGPRTVRDFLINRARPFIFSTAPSPLSARIALRALHLLQEQPQRRDKLHSLIDYADQKFAPLGIRNSGSQIIPIVIGDDRRTMRIARDIQDAGFDVRGIRPPTVPEGTSRLRVSLTLNASSQDIYALAAILEVLMCPTS